LPIVDDVWDYLEDGKWHSADEIGKKFLLSHITVQRILNFFSKYDFVKLDKMNLKVKICREAILKQEKLKIKIKGGVLQ